MPGSFNVGEIWFACEAMTPLRRLILGELLRQFFSPVHFYRGTMRHWCGGESQSLPPPHHLPMLPARSLNAIEVAQIDDYQSLLARN